MSDDIKQQVIAELKKASFGKFAIQLDELTDVIALLNSLCLYDTSVAEISRKISCSVIP